MRFPWLQVDLDFITAHSRDLGALLGVSRREAMGLAMDLWTWVLGRSTSAAPPDGLVSGPLDTVERLIAAGVDWTGDPKRLVVSLECSGLLEYVPVGVRVRGLSRYKATWEKNQRRNGTGPAPDRHLAGTTPEPARKTQTQTQTQTQKEASASQEPADAVPFALEAQKPVRAPRRPSAAERLYASLEASRQARCNEVGETFISENWPAQRQNTVLGPLIRAAPEEQGRLEVAWGLYLGDDGQRVRTPAWSLGYFLSSGVRAKYETLAAREGGA